MTRGRHVTGMVALLCALVCLLAMPAAAEQPYPPSPPPEPPASEVEVSCEIDDDRDLTCEGRGYLPDSTVTIEVRRGGSDTVVAELEVEVGADGTFRIVNPLPCDVAGGTVVVTITGRDGEDRPTVETRTLEVPPAPDCDPTDSGGVAGEQEVDGAPDGGDDGDDGDGALAFTGRNLLILAAIALLVLLLGAALVRVRRKQTDGPA